MGTFRAILFLLFYIVSWFATGIFSGWIGLTIFHVIEIGLVIYLLSEKTPQKPEYPDTSPND